MFESSTAEDNIERIRDELDQFVSDLSKHVDVKYPFIVSNEQNRKLGTQYVAAQETATDGSTKNLITVKLKESVKLLNIN